MDRSDIRHYLHNLESGLKDEIKRLQEEIDNYKSMEIEYFMTSVISDMPKAQGTITSKVEFIAIERVSHIEKLEQELCYKLLVMSVIMSAMNDLVKDSNEYKVIMHRYFNEIKDNNGWKAIASTMRLDISVVMRYENRFITRVMKKYKQKLE